MIEPIKIIQECSISVQANKMKNAQKVLGAAREKSFCELMKNHANFGEE